MSIASTSPVQQWNSSRPKFSAHPTVGEFWFFKFCGSNDRRLSAAGSRFQKGAYTSVMSLLNVMHEKGLVTREPEGRAFRYAASQQPEHHEGKLLGDLLTRVFSGSAKALVARLLEQSRPSDEELAEIRKLISNHKRQK